MNGYKEEYYELKTKYEKEIEGLKKFLAKKEDELKRVKQMIRSFPQDKFEKIVETIKIGIYYLDGDGPTSMFCESLISNVDKLTEYRHQTTR